MALVCDLVSSSSSSKSYEYGCRYCCVLMWPVPLLLDNAIEVRLITVLPACFKVCLLYRDRSIRLHIIAVCRYRPLTTAEHVAVCYLGILRACSEADFIRGCVSLHDYAHIALS